MTVTSSNVPIVSILRRFSTGFAHSRIATGLGVVGSLLSDLLQQRLGGAVDQVLGFLQAQAGDDLAYNLDDADLLVAGALQDDVELALLFGSVSGGRGSATDSGNGDRSGSGDLELLLERLDELGQLEQGQLGERVKQFLGAQLCHNFGSFLDLQQVWVWVTRTLTRRSLRRPSSPEERRPGVQPETPGRRTARQPC